MFLMFSQCYILYLAFTLNVFSYLLLSFISMCLIIIVAVVGAAIVIVNGVVVVAAAAIVVEPLLSYIQLFYPIGQW